MNKKTTLLMLFLITLSLVITGCTRSATTPVPEDTADIQSDSDFPVLTEIGPTQPPFNEFATMTAQANIVVQATEEPTVIVETPVAEVQEEEKQLPTETPVPTEPIPTATSAAAATASSPSFPVFEGYGAGFPTFGIRGVIRDDTVTIQANDFPENQTYTVLMGPMNTGAVNGIVVDTKETGSGGTYLETYLIPDSLQGSSQISIRIEFSGGRYAVNWFYNTTTQ